MHFLLLAVAEMKRERLLFTKDEGLKGFLSKESKVVGFFWVLLLASVANRFGHLLCRRNCHSRVRPED